MSDNHAQRNHLLKLFLSQFIPSSHPSHPSPHLPCSHPPPSSSSLFQPVNSSPSSSLNPPPSKPPKLNFKDEIERRYKKSELKYYVFPRRRNDDEKQGGGKSLSTSSLDELNDLECYNLYCQNMEKKKVDTLFEKLRRIPDPYHQPHDFIKKLMVAKRSDIQNQVKLQTSLYQKAVPSKRILQKTSNAAVSSLIERGSTTSRFYSKKKEVNSPKSPTYSSSNTFYMESTTKKQDIRDIRKIRGCWETEERREDESGIRRTDVKGGEKQELSREEEKKKMEEDGRKEEGRKKADEGKKKENEVSKGESRKEEEKSYYRKLQELLKKKKEEEKKALTERWENKGSLYLKMQENLLKKLRETTRRENNEGRRIGGRKEEGGGAKKQEGGGRRVGGNGVERRGVKAIWSNNPSFNSNGSSYSNSLRLLSNIGLI